MIKIVKFYRYNDGSDQYDEVAMITLRGKTIKWEKSLLPSSNMQEIEGPITIVKDDKQIKVDKETDPELWLRSLSSKYDNYKFNATDMMYMDDDGTVYKPNKKGKVAGADMIQKGVGDRMSFSAPEQQVGELSNQIGRPEPVDEVDRNPITDNKEPYFEKSEMKDGIDYWFYRPDMNKMDIDRALQFLHFDILTKGFINYQQIDAMERLMPEVENIVRKGFPNNMFEVKRSLDKWIKTKSLSSGS